MLSEKLHIDIKQEGISVIPIGVLGEITYSEEKDISLKSDDEAMIVLHLAQLERQKVLF